MIEGLRFHLLHCRHSVLWTREKHLSLIFFHLLITLLFWILNRSLNLRINRSVLIITDVPWMCLVGSIPWISLNFSILFLKVIHKPVDSILFITSRQISTFLVFLYHQISSITILFLYSNGEGDSHIKRPRILPARYSQIIKYTMIMTLRW